MSLLEKPRRFETGQMELITGLLTRRSIRRFTGAPVTEAQLQTILMAGLCAPTAENHRPFEFVVVQQRQTLQALADSNRYGHMLAYASAAIVACADERAEPDAGFVQQDCAAALENMLLAIHGLGLGGVWCGLEIGADWAQVLRDTFALPEYVRPVGVIAFGPTEAKPAPREYWQPDKIHLEHW